MNRLRPLLLVCAMILAAASLQDGLRAAAGDMVWEDIVNLGFFRTDGRIAGIENGRVHAVLSGVFTDSPSSNAKVMTRTYDARTGVLLWSDTWEVSPSDDSGRGAVADAVVLVAASTMLNSTEPIATYSVRAYDAASGEVLWSDECGSGTGTDYGARNVVAVGHQFLVAGVCQGDGFVRAYEPGTGRVAWETETFPFGFGLSFPAIVSAGNRLLLVDFDPLGGPFVRALDARSGESLWASDPIPAGGGGASEMLATSGVAVVAAGRVVTAIDTSSGAILWSVDFGDVVGEPDLISLKGSRLTLAIDLSFEADPVVRVYDARSGSLVSEDPNGVVDPGMVRGNLRYFAGSRVPLEPPMGVREFFIQAFEARGGGGKSAADRSAALERRR